jgi:3-hydroxyisobutyrate dehydrogenase-like beta-hydroxyacid dehydrogenase
LKVGVIGLGNIGKGMAINLAKAGHELVTLRLKTHEPIPELHGKYKVRTANNPREVGALADIIFLSLPPEVSVAVVTGRDGVLEGAKQGTLIIETSTIPLEHLEKMAVSAKKKGVALLDSPVSGGKTLADEGTLTFFVGGKKEDFEKAYGILQIVGKNIFYVGELGSGQVVKLVSNLLAMTNIACVFEALILAATKGIDLRTLYEANRVSAGQSWEWEHRIPAWLKGEYTGTPVSGCIHVLSLLKKLGKDCKVKMPMTDCALEVFQQYAALGMIDCSEIAEVIRRESNENKTS